MSKLSIHELRAWLDKIVPVKALGIELVWTDASNWYVLAPLELNRNHMGTGFGGSIATVATLAGWVQTWLLLEDAQDYDIVIANSEVTFKHPVTSEIAAYAVTPAAAAVTRFQQAARERQQATITVHSEVRTATATAAEFCGRFVAIRKATSSTDINA